ncbi:Transposon Tf2-6 polyprotein, partial [Caligus rogercresseyi]
MALPLGGESPPLQNRALPDGYTANPGLVDALTKFPVPKNRTDVRSFCGLVQQFEALSADLTGLLEPIRALLPARSAFVWEGLQQQAFEKTIAELTSPRVLTQFRPGANLRLETDASQRFGLGFALYQEEGVWNLIAEILEIRPRGRSYLVKTESGRLYWRNRRYLKLYAPPIGVAKDIPESQEEVKQPRRSKRQKKAP